MIDLDELREYYTAEEIPPCRLCGAELTIGKMGGGEATVWHCSEASPLKRAREGASETEIEAAWKHFRDSEYIQYRQGDSRVIALIERVGELEGALAEAAIPLEVLDLLEHDQPFRQRELRKWWRKLVSAELRAQIKKSVAVIRHTLASGEHEGS